MGKYSLSADALSIRCNKRTNAWITHCHLLSRNFEGTYTSSEAFIYLAMSKLMVAR